jgi:RHS repeat-associated protein
VSRTEFTYDAFGRRVKIVEKTGSGAITSTKQFVWAGGSICEERDANNNVTKRFFPEGQINYTSTTNTELFYTRDHLGSVREVTDKTGLLRARYDYDPYGRRSPNQVVGANAVEADFGFTGHYFHAPSGLHLARFRAYDSDSGRWLNRDPIGERGGLNLYGYVANSPIGLYDPQGLLFSCLFQKLGDLLGSLFRGHTTADPNSYIAQRTEELGPTENIIPDLVSDLVTDTGDILTDIAAAEVAGALAGSVVDAAAGALAEGAAGAAKGGEIIAQNGTKITGFTGHGIERVIGDTANRAGTKPQAILDALKNPQKIVGGVDQQGRPFQIFTGGDARVVVNPQTGKVISVNPLSGAGAH